MVFYQGLTLHPAYVASQDLELRVHYGFGAGCVRIHQGRQDAGRR
jgi:hypothetical protein